MWKIWRQFQKTNHTPEITRKQIETTAKQIKDILTEGKTEMTHQEQKECETHILMILNEYYAVN